MADGTKIEWSDATWNIVTGCSVVSPGCTNCYAMHLAGTRLQHHPSRAGLTKQSKAGPVWTGEVRLNEKWLTQPLRWKRPRMIFVCAHGDLFHESVPDAWIDRVFAVMALAPRHTFQVLTKRAKRMRRYFEGEPAQTRRSIVNNTCFAISQALGAKFTDEQCRVREWPLTNVWLGVSAERQKEADERIPHLLATPADLRFVSCEPLLGPIRLINIPIKNGPNRGEGDRGFGVMQLDWVIVGGESGPDARPMHPDWARSLRDQCVSAGVAFFMKQMGGPSKARMPAIPDDLMVRELPHA